MSDCNFRRLDAQPETPDERLGRRCGKPSGHRVKAQGQSIEITCKRVEGHSGVHYSFQGEKNDESRAHWGWD